MATGGEAARARWLAALRAAYEPGSDPAERAALLARLLAELTPAEREEGRSRWRAWAYDLPASGTGTAEEQRFLALLPALLARTLDPEGEDYTWIQQCLGQWDAAQAEYAELQQILDEERAARQGAADDEEGGPPPAFPAPDLSFLATPLAEAVPNTDWAAVQVTAKGEAQAGARRILLTFRPRDAFSQVAEEPARYEPQPDQRLAGMADPGGEWIHLLARTLDLGGPPGHPGSVTVVVQAQRNEPATCRLFIHLSGPGVEGHETEARLLVEWPDHPTTESPPDPQGLTRLMVPLADLRRLVITVQLSP